VVHRRVVVLQTRGNIYIEEHYPYSFLWLIRNYCALFFQICHLWNYFLDSADVVVDDIDWEFIWMR
jgi:hypothetical protein